jgi:putative ABC transport system permease protein
VKAFVRFQSNSGESGVALRYGDATHYWKNSYFSDDNVFDVFPHRILHGDPKTALKDGASIAISETVARTYFGDSNPIGENLLSENGIAMKVALVFADLPPNTHLKYDLLYSGNSPALREPENAQIRIRSLWGVGIYTYVQMAPGFKPEDWASLNDEFYERYMAEVGRQGNSHWRSWVEPLAWIHLNSDVGFDLPRGNPLYLYGCTAVALFILLVACINYMNLATARATRRARAVGIRKILGASRASLALQFLGEAVLFSLLSLVLAYVLVEVALTLTPIAELMDDQVTQSVLREPSVIATLVALSVLMGLVAGAYPAIYLSSWAPLTALTGKTTGGKGSLRFREVLVLVQFTISAAVIACTLLMAAQMRYVNNKSLGFGKENRLVVALRGVDTIEKLPTIRSELQKNPSVKGVSQVAVIVGNSNFPINTSKVEAEDGNMVDQQLYNMPIGEDFVKTMGMTIVQGRDFSSRLLTDVGTNFLVNETMVKRMGWSNPLGKQLSIRNMSGRVVGVLEDFNFQSLHKAIEPFVLYAINNDFSRVQLAVRPLVQNRMIVDVAGQDMPETLGYIEDVMRKLDPQHPFTYSFLDQQLDDLYKSEQRLMKLIGLFAGICVFIACLGLFGLAAFTTEQRTREIGTRKVLGATTWQIILLLARRILLLVGIAAVLATVASYFAIDEWLTNFAYRALINPAIFLLSAAVAAAVAFATVALQSYRTASADPVHSLRHV